MTILDSENSHYISPQQVKEFSDENSKFLEIMLFITKFFNEFQTDKSKDEIQDYLTFIRSKIDYLLETENRFDFDKTPVTFLNLENNLDWLMNINSNYSYDDFKNSVNDTMSLLIFNLCQMDINLSFILRWKILSETEINQSLEIISKLMLGKMQDEKFNN